MQANTELIDKVFSWLVFGANHATNGAEQTFVWKRPKIAQVVQVTHVLRDVQQQVWRNRHATHWITLLELAHKLNNLVLQITQIVALWLWTIHHIQNACQHLHKLGVKVETLFRHALAQQRPDNQHTTLVAHTITHI